MERLAIVLTVFAAMIVVSRGALVIWPTATVEWFRQALSTPGRVRAFAGLIAVLGVALAVTGRQDSSSHVNIAAGAEFVGWMFGAFAGGLLVAPAGFRDFMYSILDSISDPGALRMLGTVGVSIGLALGWLAVFVM